MDSLYAKRLYPESLDELNATRQIAGDTVRPLNLVESLGSLYTHQFDTSSLERGSSHVGPSYSWGALASPGDYIRLLKPTGFHKGWSVYELKIFSLKRAPRYAALSYSWGTQGSYGSIILDNGFDRITMDITLDFQSALDTFNRLQQGIWPAWIWADQICINQSNREEKEDQVRRMRAIYGQADCVLVWLGDEMRDETHEGYEATFHSGPNFGVSYAKTFNLLLQRSYCWWNRLWVR